MRRVCFVVPQVYPYFDPNAGVPFGGAERQVFCLGTELADSRHFEIHYCVADYGQPAHEVREGCHLWSSFAFSDNRALALVKLCRILKRVAADIYVFRSANASIYPIMLFIRGILKRRTLYMVAHDYEGSAQNLARMTNWLTAMLMSRVYASTDLLCVQTADQAAMFRDRCRSEPHLTRNLYPRRQVLNQRRRSGEFSIWVGRATPWKRPDLFLKLARTYPSEEFVMVCPVGRDGHLHAQAKNEAGELPNLTFIEGLPPQALLDYFCRAKVYVLTSEAEGFSNTMMDAMACACPILSYAVDPDGIIASNDFGMVASDTEDFIGLFGDMVRDEARAERMGDNGLKHLVANHTGNMAVEPFARLLK